MAYGLLVTAIGALAIALSLAFGLWEITRFGLAVVALGAAVSVFGGAEFFFTRGK